MGPFFCRVGCRRNVGGKRVPDYSSRVGWPFRIGPSRKMHSGMSAQTGTHFPDRPSSGSCVPDSGSRVGCRFRLRSLAEAVSRNRASEWDVLSRQELKWKLRPGFKPRNGTCFPDGRDCGRFLGPLRGPSQRGAELGRRAAAERIAAPLRIVSADPAPELLDEVLMFTKKWSE